MAASDDRKFTPPDPWVLADAIVFSRPFELEGGLRSYEENAAWRAGAQRSGAQKASGRAQRRNNSRESALELRADPQSAALFASPRLGGQGAAAVWWSADPNAEASGSDQP
jgi:hypothetical protein